MRDHNTIGFDEDLVGDVSMRPNDILLASLADTPRYQVREVESNPHVEVVTG